MRGAASPHIQGLTLAFLLLVNILWSHCKQNMELKQKIFHCSGVIGFVLCSTEGPAVDFKNPINPIEKLDGAMNHKRELKFYNSDVSLSQLLLPHRFTWTKILTCLSLPKQMHRAAFALPTFMRREVASLMASSWLLLGSTSYLITRIELRRTLKRGIMHHRRLCISKLTPLYQRLLFIYIDSTATLGALALQKLWFNKIIHIHIYIDIS